MSILSIVSYSHSNCGRKSNNCLQFIHICHQNRYWRKTRSTHSNGSPCVGVDANRNFGFKWMGERSDMIEYDFVYVCEHRFHDDIYTL